MVTIPPRTRLEMLAVVRDFVDHEVRPVVNGLEHANDTREAHRADEELGHLRIAIPEEYDSTGEHALLHL